MAHNPNFKPVLLTADQMNAIKRIQAEHREQSQVGAAPSISSIARGLIDKALKAMPGAISQSTGA